MCSQSLKDGVLAQPLRRLSRRVGAWREARPVFWAHLGQFSQVMAERLPRKTPPTLVLSLPRSGSSWAGATLGNAPDALYLREPLTEHYRESGGKGTVFEVAPAAPPRAYARAASLAFSAVPRFSTDVIVRPQQWGLWQMRNSRLVIKEVNPLASEWFVRQFRPRIIFLLRHPAAVALSYHRLGWWDIPDDLFWQHHGAFQGNAHSIAWRILQSYDDCLFVSYEELCANPVERYRDLFAFAGLQWTPAVERFVHARTSGGDDQKHWTIARDSAQMIDAWKDQISAEDLKALETAYRECDTPWFQSNDDWMLDREGTQIHDA